MAPEGWVDIEPGELLREMPDPDLTLVQQQLVPDITSRELIGAFAAQQNLEKIPEIVDTIETAPFTWDLYDVEVARPRVGKAMVDVALPVGADWAVVARPGHGPPLITIAHPGRRAVIRRGT